MKEKKKTKGWRLEIIYTRNKICLNFISGVNNLHPLYVHFILLYWEGNKSVFCFCYVKKKSRLKR